MTLVSKLYIMKKNLESGVPLSLSPKGVIMKEYELMTIFPQDEEKSKQGREAVSKVLKENGAEIENEAVFADRNLPYVLIDRTDNSKLKAGRFVLYMVKVNPDKVSVIANTFKITAHLLKYMFVAVDEK